MTLILSEAKRRLVEVEIRYRRGLRARAQLRIVKNLGAVVRRVTAFRLDAFNDGIDVGMFTGQYLPYKASETYRAMKIEFERRRAECLLEVRQLSSRV